MLKKVLLVALLIVVLVAVSACAASPNDQVNVPNTDGQVAGFWLGLWHGIIAPITFIISLFNHNIAIYEVHNNGGWYNFGFLLGLTAIWGGGGSGAGRASRRRRDR